MIINSSKVKTEALLLFCRDLINSYDAIDENLFNVSDDINSFIDTRIKQLQKSINIEVQPIEYYLRNKNVSRINMILKSYEYINNTISKELKNGDKFNPSMLCFSLLSTWFAELEMVQNEKKYIYFRIYPYSEIYDTLLLNLNNLEFKNINITMLNIAELTAIKLNRYRFK